MVKHAKAFLQFDGGNGSVTVFAETLGDKRHVVIDVLPTIGRPGHRVTAHLDVVAAQTIGRAILDLVEELAKA